MRRYRKIVWQEGMFITPHHFQQSDLYHEGILDSRINSFLPFNWGVVHYEIDKDALSNGNIIIPSLKLIMQDGTPISVPDIDRAPDVRNFSEFFQPAMDTLSVFIGLPLLKEGAPNYKIKDNSKGQENKNVRYIVQSTAISDLVSGENEKELFVADNNLQIFFSGELLDDFSTIKIAEINRSSAGGFHLNQKYIPPCVHLKASPELVAIMRSLLEALNAKSSALSDQRRRKSQTSAEFGISDITHFWLLHSVNSFIPLLMHLYNVQQHHPENLYTVLVQLTGELLTFAMEGHPNEAVPYIHDNQGKTFMLLDKRIRELLEIVVSTKWVQIPLEKTKQTQWVGRVDNDKLFEVSRFYLIAMGNISEEKVREQLPHTIKIGSINTIDTIINAALPGIPVSYTPLPPGSVPMKAGAQYFLLDSSSEFWETITKSRTFAIYLPKEFAELKIEMIALKEK
ncbi:MAG: type VI secretion system baseplate subunit TssK [Nitrospirae bacterium]|nr:type VI secretion system baseplate subunit TssK [Nitrospirota bacterium]